MGLGIGRLFFKAINRDEYVKIPIGLLLSNWFFQRVMRINAKVPFSVNFTSRVVGSEYMDIHPSVRLSFAASGGTHIAADKKGSLTIGKDTIFAYNVCIHTVNHDLKDRNIFHGCDVVIGENCWLGNSVTILPGVVLGDNVTVGANSVVTKSFPSNVVVGGIPAKILKEI